MDDEARDRTEAETDDAEATGQSRSLSWNQGVVVAGLVMSLPWLVFGPAAFGYYLDYVFGTSPWFTLSLLGVGIVGSAIDVFVILRRVGLMK